MNDQGISCPGNEVLMAFTDEEKNAVYAVEKACFADCWTPEMLSEELDNPLCVTVALTENGAVMGYALGRVAADEAELFRIGVMPDSRGRGAGMRLLMQLHELMKTRGAAVCFLEVRSLNAPARALYRKAGYEEIAVRRGYYGDDDAVIMKAVL